MKRNLKWSSEKQIAFHEAWTEMILQAWNDPAYKQQLLKDPMGAFKKKEIEFPHGMECKIEANTEQLIHITLPKKPLEKLSESQLKNIAAADNTANEGACLSG